MKRAALLIHFLSAAVIAVAYGSAFLPGGAPGWAAPLLAVGTGGILVSAMAVGAARRGRIGSLAAPFAAVFLLVSGGLLLLLALPAAETRDPVLVLGLPTRAAILLYGIGLLPALVVPLAYALTFDELTLSEEDLERIRRAAAKRSDAGDAGPGGGGRDAAESGFG